MTGGAACGPLAAPNPAQPIAFPTNFPDEAFWFMGDATFTANGVDVTYVANLEAAFGGGAPEAGQQIAFARIRIRITLPATAPGGNCTITHPYGVEVFSVPPGGGIRVINETHDIGIGAAGELTGALAGDIGPFLMDASVPASGLIPSSIPGELYIGDPNTPRPVVGSPFGTNFVRVDGPVGFASVQSNLFSVMGKVHAGALATPLKIERTSYARKSDGAGGNIAQQDVFVQAPPSSSAAVSAWDANAAQVSMSDPDTNGTWYGQSASDPSGIPAPAVSVSASALSGPNTASTGTRRLVDVVSISRAGHSLATQTLTVEASSSDEVTPPALTANGQTLTGAGVVKSATFSGLKIPPATVSVTSANGGSDTEQVAILP